MFEDKISQLNATIRYQQLRQEADVARLLDYRRRTVPSILSAIMSKISVEKKATSGLKSHPDILLTVILPGNWRLRVSLGSN